MAKPNIEEKETLSIEEAAEYFNLSRINFRKFLKEKGSCDYIACYRNRTLIISSAFEKYLIENPKVKEELTYAGCRTWKKKA